MTWRGPSGWQAMGRARAGAGWASVPARGRVSGLAAAAGPGGGPGCGRLGSGRGGGAGGCAAAGVAGGGLGREAALVVAFEVELLFGVPGAGAPGVGQGLDGVQLGGAGGGLGVAFAGGVGADMVVFGAGVGFGLPGPADLGVSVVAVLSCSGQRLAGVPADLGDLGVCLVADGLCAGLGGVRVGAGGVGGLQRGLGVVPGGVHRGGGGAGQFSGLGEQLLQAGQRAAVRGGLLPGSAGAEAIVVVPLA